MKRVTLLCGLLLALTATVASAAGVGIRWTECIGDGGLLNRNFACNVNTGSNVLVGTFQLGAAGLAQTSGEEIVVDLGSASATLPAWWQFKNTGTCRTGSLAIGAAPTANAANCADWGGGLAGAGLGAYIIGARGPNTARIVAASAVPPSGLQDLSGGQEYFAFTLAINNLKTVNGGCTGCQTAVCIVFNSLNMTTPVLANNVLLTGPSNGTDADFCTWQGGAGVIVGGTPGCGAATPTKNATWGAVKAMYH
jgi:hypothetical protein